MNNIVIGVDAGTTAVKAVAFDMNGKIQATCHRSVPVNYGDHGEAEQDMNEIWEAVATCLSEVNKEIGNKTVVAIGLTGQGDGLWLVNNEGNPVRPAMIWLDGRANARVEEWNNNGKNSELLAITGTNAFGGLLPILTEELRDSSPEDLELAVRHLNCKDWIRFKLTGKQVTDYTEASRSLLDVRDVSGYNQELSEKLGLGKELSILPKIVGPADPCYPLSDDAAVKTGLPAGTPVGIGMIDVAVTGMGLGTINDGDSWLILGTTGFIGTLHSDVSKRKTDCSMVIATGQGKQVLEFTAPMTGTPNLDWIRTTLGLENMTWQEIEKVAKESPAGARGVIYLPYASLGGERAPFLDANASASWQGMSLTSTRADILRSVYEGVAFSLVECINVLEIQGDLVVSGGGFRSDLICQILADATGKNVVRQDAPEAGARGAAVLALVSAGICKTIAEAAENLGTNSEYFAPNPQMKVLYDQAYKLFVETRKALQPLWSKMRQVRANSVKQG